MNCVWFQAYTCHGEENGEGLMVIPSSQRFGISHYVSLVAVYVHMYYFICS